MAPKFSDFAPGEIRVFIDGQLLAPGRTKVAANWPEGDRPWVSITTDPDDQTYRHPPLEDSTPGPDGR